jgi:dTDP-glucose 4,6-dehydratase
VRAGCIAQTRDAMAALHAVTGKRHGRPEADRSGRTEGMMENTRLFLVTGGLGFIGKNFVQRCLDEGHYVTNIDVMNYAADRKVAKSFHDYERYRHIEKDVSELPYLAECDCVVNFAAESHVDNSIADSRKFCQTNFLGTQRLLELVRAKAPAERPLFVQISTDEVYGDIISGQHKESDNLLPSNPYSATKAAADMLVFGWARTYGLTYNIIRMSNNYGMHQYPEKLIPKSSARMLRKRPALLHGKGEYFRNWLHVEDSVDAILTVIDRGERNAIYNVSGNAELRNIDVVIKIAKILGVPENLAYEFVADRVGQDVRYSLDCERLHALGWRAQRDFDAELVRIIENIDFQRFI